MPDIKIGDKVRCFVHVNNDLVPMHTGIVTEIRSGYYLVDRMSLHGGAPWIVPERFVRKEAEDERETFV